MSFFLEFMSNFPLSFCNSGPVLSLAISSNGEQCFSGGIDATIQWWNMPSPNVDPYDTYGEYRGTVDLFSE